MLSSWQPPPVQECRVSSTEPLRVGKLADSMALAAAVEAPYLRFRPALNDRERVSVWIEIPVTLYFRASDEDPPPPS